LGKLFGLDEEKSSRVMHCSARNGTAKTPAIAMRATPRSSAPTADRPMMRNRFCIESPRKTNSRQTHKIMVPDLPTLGKYGRNLLENLLQRFADKLFAKI
jgi:hypothetical protein